MEYENLTGQDGEVMIVGGGGGGTTRKGS